MRGEPYRPCGRRAADYHIDPNRIVIIGFSAGGHLAALASTQFVPGKPDADDPIERVSSRPDYTVLGYPWIGAISTDTSHLSYCKLFNVMDRCEELRAAYSPDLFVTKETPPTFWFHTFNDETVPVEQGLRYYEALVKAGVPAEAHIFANGRARCRPGQSRCRPRPMAQPARVLAARAGVIDGEPTTAKALVGVPVQAISFH